MCKSPYRFILIGMDDNSEPGFTDQVKDVIRNGKVFSGGERHRQIVQRLLPPDSTWIPLTVPLSDTYDRYLNNFRQTNGELEIIIFTSGDPLFYGLAATLQRVMPDVSQTVYPAFHSLQTLAHRLLLPYGEMRHVSLTGRPWQELDKAVIEGSPLIGILTDRSHTPAAIAQRLIDYHYTYYNIYVGEHLGNPQQERVQRLSLQQAADGVFSLPNCVILQADRQAILNRPAATYFGIPDHCFDLLNGRSRMITKAPLRLLTLQAMELGRRHVMWDIGFCTGSVSIEARLRFPHLDIVAFEQREEGRQLMDTNTHRLGAPGIQTFIGDFLQTDLEALPRPDTVFIGGHGGHLTEMVQRLYSYLQPGGCIVFNSVSASSKQEFLQAAEHVGLICHEPLHVCLNDYNPIEILKATLPPNN